MMKSKITSGILSMFASFVIKSDLCLKMSRIRITDNTSDRRVACISEFCVKIKIRVA